MPTQKRPATAADTSTAFSDDERAAMKERAAEVRATRRRSGGTRTDGTADVLAKIAELSGSDRTLAERIFAIVAETAPNLEPKTWYGMPAWARDGKVVCFFQSAAKFKARYATLGFNDPANLDDGSMWPTAFALTALTESDERIVAGLIRRAAG